MPRAWGEGLSRWSTGDFVGQWNYFVWYCNGGHMTCICHNVYTAQTVNLNVYKFFKNYLRRWGILGKNTDHGKRI